MLKRSLNILFILLALAGTRVFAQEFTSSVDKSKVGENETFQVYFTFKGQNTNGLRNFSAPSFTGFRVLSGPNQSTSMQYINGAMSSSVTYSFYLQGSEIGKYTIEAASIEYNGTRITTEPIVVEVVKGSAPGQKQNTNSSGQASGGISNEELAENVFIRAIPDRQSVLLGQQVTVTYKLYTRLNINSPQISKLPSYQGFWSEELEMNNNIYFTEEMYNNIRFRTAVLKTVALFPSKTGELSVTPFELTVPVMIKKKRSNDPFDQFFNDSFFGRTETVEFKAVSNTLKIQVNALPSQGVPSSFKGAVGKFSFRTEFDKSEVKTNESITLRVTINGTGNIKLLDVPKPQLPPGFEQYEPKVSETIARKGAISGTKVVEYLLVPRIPGTKKIPPIEFSFFDLDQKRYVTLATPEHILTVAEGEGDYEMAGNGLSKEDVKLLSEDIRYIRLSSFDLEKKKDFRAVGAWFWLGLILPALILGVVLGIKKRNDTLHGNVTLLKYRKAEKQARGRLKAAKKELSTGDLTNFYSELSQALFGYLEDKLGIQKSDFTLEKAVAELTRRGVDEVLVSSVKEISEKCEFARFAPSAQNSVSANELYEESVSLIVTLEDKILVKRK
ncbi:MAG: BatD family protein [Bacteroidetes bacterium]|nr:BatD family protein [Bacteroidota bacterium]